MNYIQHLNAFFLHLQKEKRLNANHISLYLALFQCWNYNHFQNPFRLFRQQLMKMSGIGSKNTYLNCLKQLHQFGYIVYHPALHRYHLPSASILKWEAGNPRNQQIPLFLAEGPENTVNRSLPSGGNLSPVQVPEPGQPFVKTDPQPVPDLSHFNKQQINNTNIEGTSPAPSTPLQYSQTPQTNAPAAPHAAPGAGAAPPPWAQVQEYFNGAGFPIKEAARFFNHYQANGWKQAGKSPITNWQAAANKWMLYSTDAKNNAYGKANHLHTGQHKDYSDPL